MRPFTCVYALEKKPKTIHTSKPSFYSSELTINNNESFYRSHNIGYMEVWLSVSVCQASDLM